MGSKASRKIFWKSRGPKEGFGVLAGVRNLWWTRWGHSVSPASLGLQLEKQKPKLNHFLLITHRLSEYFFFLFLEGKHLTTNNNTILNFGAFPFSKHLPPLTYSVLTTRPKWRPKPSRERIFGAGLIPWESSVLRRELKSRGEDSQGLFCHLWSHTGRQWHS